MKKITKVEDIKMIGRGTKIAPIARQLGVSRPTIYRRLKKFDEFLRGSFQKKWKQKIQVSHKKYFSIIKKQRLSLRKKKYQLDTYKKSYKDIINILKYSMKPPQCDKCNYRKINRYGSYPVKLSKFLKNLGVNIKDVYVLTPVYRCHNEGCRKRIFPKCQFFIPIGIEPLEWKRMLKVNTKNVKRYI